MFALFPLYVVLVVYQPSMSHDRMFAHSIGRSKCLMLPTLKSATCLWLSRPGMATYLLLLGLQQENSCVTGAGSVKWPQGQNWTCDLSPLPAMLVVPSTTWCSWWEMVSIFWQWTSLEVEKQAGLGGKWLWKHPTHIKSSVVCEWPLLSEVVCVGDHWERSQVNSV